MIDLSTVGWKTRQTPSPGSEDADTTSPVHTQCSAPEGESLLHSLSPELSVQAPVWDQCPQTAPPSTLHLSTPGPGIPGRGRKWPLELSIVPTHLRWHWRMCLQGGAGHRSMWSSPCPMQTKNIIWEILSLRIARRRAGEGTGRALPGS